LSTKRIKHSLPILFAVSLVLLCGLGCLKNRSASEPIGPEEAWHKAKALFERERYSKAQQVLRDIVLNYSGSAIIDSAQFYLARTYFEMGNDYLAAADEFHKMQEQFSSSALGGAAQFWEARSYFEQAPSYQLDQSYTTKALQGFQRFLEEHPGDALADSGYHYLALCRDKLAHKEYAAANLYFDLGEYASSILYADVVLSNYYDTIWAGPAQFTKGRGYYELKDWTRARQELQSYLDKYPQGKYTLRVRELLAIANRHVEGGPASTP
jgi:outer membrane protein assembly factor BamD